MAKQQSVETADGDVIENAYFVPGQINVGVADKGGMLYLHSYRNAAAMDAGKSPLNGPNASKSYAFTPEQYLAATAITLRELIPSAFPEGDPRGNITMYQVLGSFAYKVAQDRKDVPVLGADGEPALNADGNPIMKSFFEDATNV